MHRATNFPNEYRTLSDCVAPFVPGSPVGAAGLQLESAECDLVECPFYNEWRGGEVPNATEHARRFVPTTRTWSNSTFLSGALACGRTADEAAELVDEMFARYERTRDGEVDEDDVAGAVTLEPEAEEAEEEEEVR